MTEEDAARRGDGGDARSDDVSDADQFGGNLHADRSGLERRAEDLFRYVLPKFEGDIERLVDQADEESAKDDLRARRLAETGGGGGPHLRLRGRRRHGAILGVGARLEDRGAGRALRIFEDAVLLHDECAAQRDHHKDAKQPAENSHEHDPRDLEVEAEDEDGRHRDAETAVCVMLFSRMVESRTPSLESPRKSASEMTATGIEALTVRPTFSTR